MSENQNGNGGVPGKEVNLHDFIKERKAERKKKAEEKRQVDLKRIRDMKSRAGIDPLQRFPKEIWAKIFNELDPDDRGNAWQVHPTFRDSMKSRRVQDILLPVVLKLETFERYVNYKNGNEVSDDFNYEQLRGVSKSVMKSFDRRMEEKLLKRMQEAENSYVAGVVRFRSWSKNERQLLKRLLVSFRNDQENPGKLFFRRDLYICLSDDYIEFDEDGQDIQELVDDYKRDLTSLLEVIGDQIWHFNFKFDNLKEVGNFAWKVYVLLQQLVALMPNLKWLEVDIRTHQVIYDWEGVDKDSILQKHPFPHLASLERLTCHWPFEAGVDGEVFNIYQTVIKANQHLKILDLDVGFESLPGDLIKSLPLTGFHSCSVSLNSATRLENIQHIVNFNWSLKTINLSLDYSGTGASSSMSSLLRFLGRFPTLAIVKLKKLRAFVFTKGDVFEYLKLPNLTDFELRLRDPQIGFEGNLHFFFSLQFLLHCKKLKTLKWNMFLIDDGSELRKYLKDHENGNTIDFRAGLAFLYESNIWDVFPSLETVEVNITKLLDDNYSCSQEYRRGTFSGPGRMSVKQFLKSHGCSSKNSLQSSR